MMTIDGALLLAIAVLLPFRLLPFAYRFFPPLKLRSPPAVTSAARSVALFIAVGLVLTAALDFSHGWSSDRAAMAAEIEQLKAKTEQLDSILWESQDTLNYKKLYLDEKEKIVEEMEQSIQILQNDLHEIKGATNNLLLTEKRIRALEEEVQYLSDLSRKNIKDINILESLADDAMEKLDSSTLEVEKMESIVTEQWIQIQQLEQAFQLTKIMAARVLKRNSHNSHNRGQPRGKPIWKMVQQFLESISRRKVTNTVNVPDSFFLGAFPRSCISQLQQLFQKIFLCYQNFHTELLELVRNSLKMYEFTATSSNELVVSILAAAIMVLPFFCGWIALVLFLDDEEEA